MSDRVAILKQLGSSLVGENSFTGSSASELIGFYLCWAQVLSPTVTLCKRWILYPCVGRRMQLSSAGLEHSWCKLLFPGSPPETTCLSSGPISCDSEHPCALESGSRQGSGCLRGAASTSSHSSANSLQTSAAVQCSTWWLRGTEREHVCLRVPVHESWLVQPVTA